MLFPTFPPDLLGVATHLDSLPFTIKYKVWLSDVDYWRTLQARHAQCPVLLQELVLEVVTFLTADGYVPRSKRALRQKIRNCMEVAARKAGPPLLDPLTRHRQAGHVVEEGRDAGGRKLYRCWGKPGEAGECRGQIIARA